MKKEKKKKLNHKYFIVILIFSLGLFSYSQFAMAVTYFEWDGESGYQYLGAGNAHSGGGYFSHLGGSVSGAEGILPNPCSSRDTNNYHYTVNTNETDAQSSIFGSQYSLKTPYTGYCNDESFTRDTTIIQLNENKDEYYIRWSQKWTGNWMNGNVQHKFTKFTEIGGSDEVSAGYFSFSPNGRNWRCRVPNLENRFDMNGISHASVVWVYASEDGAGSQYVGVNRAWDDINNNVNGEDGEFYFETDRWYDLEIHAKMNSNSQTADAELEAWVDGEQVFGVYNFKWYNQPEDEYGIGNFELQHIYYNRATNDNQPTYMDNIKISDSYIGPVSSSDTTPPSAPSGLSVS